MFSEILTIIAPVFIVAFIGFVFEKKGLGLQSETLSRLAMYVGTPCLLFSNLTGTDLSDAAILRYGALAVVGVAICAIPVGLVLLAFRLPFRTFLPSLTVPNAGNTGLPLVLFAFGEPGLTIGVAYFFAISFVQYSVVPILVSGNMSLRAFFGQPLIWSLAAVAFFRTSGVTIPTVVENTTELLSGIMIPVMLLLLGGALSRLKVSDTVTSVSLAVLRLVAGVATGLVLVTLFGLSGVEAGAVFLLTAMPSALVTYVISAHYNQEPERVAGVVVSSTVLSLSCLPILLSIAIYLSNA